MGTLEILTSSAFWVAYLELIWEYTTLLFTGIWQVLLGIDKMSGLLTAIAAAVAAWCALKGLREWKNQLRGTSNFAVAKELMKAVYNVKSQFKYVRGMGWSSELKPDATDQRGEVLDGREYEAYEYLYENRLGEHTKSFMHMEEVRLNACIELGGEYEDATYALRKLRAELIEAVRNFLLQFKERDGFPDDDLRIRDELVEKSRAIVEYPMHGKGTDDFSNRLNEAVKWFEDQLSPIIHEGQERKEKLFIRRLFGKRGDWGDVIANAGQLLERGLLLFER